MANHGAATYGSGSPVTEVPMAGCGSSFETLELAQCIHGKCRPNTQKESFKDICTLVLSRKQSPVYILYPVYDTIKEVVSIIAS